MVRFVGNAQVRRLRGATLADEITGSLITYDNAAEVFSVSGGAPAATARQPERPRARGAHARAKARSRRRRSGSRERASA